MPACDGQTDGQTDVKPIAITCFSIADARKNSKKYSNMMWSENSVATDATVNPCGQKITFTVLQCMVQRAFSNFFNLSISLSSIIKTVRVKKQLYILKDNVLFEGNL